MDIEFAMELG